MVYRSLLYFLTLALMVFLFLSCDSQPTQVENGDNGDNGPPDNGTVYSHTDAPGNAAADFLLEENFDELIVEIQYMPGARPVDESLDELRVFLENHLNKQITILEPEEIPSGNQESYSAADVRDLEAEHRQHFTVNSTLASYNIFVDGEYTQENVLGIAYYNTSNAYFGETISRVSGSPPFNPSRRNIEGTVLRHEYGHLIGLVNNGVPMEEHHQENGAHCSDEECVMFASVNTSDFFHNLFDGSIPDLDDFCLADIEGFRSE
jgi:hypothetical protein